MLFQKIVDRWVVAGYIYILSLFLWDKYNYTLITIYYNLNLGPPKFN